MNVYQVIENCTDASALYSGVRDILEKLDRKGRYPEDWEIKNIQRKCDAKYAELTEGK